MEVEKKKRSDTRSFWSSHCRNSNSKKLPIEENGLDSSNAGEIEERPGWKAIPYILGNETIERIATYGMAANFMVYLLKVFNLGQVAAANVLSIWLGVSNFIPIIGATIADVFLGKFRTIAVASIGTLVGIVILTLTAWLPQLHPPNCTSHHHQQLPCVPPTTTQLTILILGLCWLAIGTGGIRPCAIPFAIDQFDTTTLEGKKGVSRFFNWYYTTQTLVLLINTTVIVYIQNKNWVVGFGSLGVLMLCAIIIFVAGKSVYLCIPAEGSIFSGIVKVFVAAYKKHHLRIPAMDEEEGVYYDPPLEDDKALKMPLSKQFRFLNKAAMIQSNELNAEGRVTNTWSLCSIQQVEEVKCLIKILPIWASGILSSIPIVQQGTFPITQALKMNRHIGQFEIPAASFNIVSLITIGIWLPCYDFFVQPALAKVTKQVEGITSLQKIVIGNIFSVLIMVSAGIVEWQRRVMAISHNAPNGIAPMSALWLSPQYVMLGFAEVFTTIGYIDFYNSESPDKMKSIGNSLQYLVSACSTYAGVLVMNIVHRVTQKKGKIGWLNNDINAGRLDYYYFLISGLGALNLVYLIFCVKRYRYKVIVKAQVLGTP